MDKKNRFARSDIFAAVICAALLLANLGLIGSTGRERAKRAVCLANLGRLTVAWHAFADDHNGNLVSGNIRSKPDAWIFASFTADQRDNIRKGALFPYVGATGVYRCPSNRWSNPFCTYKIPGGANGEDWQGYIPATRYSELQKPASRYVFVETIDPRGYNMGSWQMNVQSKTWVAPLLIWHNSRTTLGFADGHAETRRWVDKTLIDWCTMAIEDPAHFNFGMTPPAGEREDVEYMASGFPYKSLE
jgi:prepilin-type processing-associated H-X9-DG protein